MFNVVLVFGILMFVVILISIIATSIKIRRRSKNIFNSVKEHMNGSSSNSNNRNGDIIGTSDIFPKSLKDIVNASMKQAFGIDTEEKTAAQPVQQEIKEKRYCEYCGAAIAEDSFECKGCGAKITKQK